MKKRKDFLPVSRPLLGGNEISRAVAVLESGMWTTGKVVTEFETNLSEFLDGTPCVGLNSCTAALHLALLALGIGSGDEVIVPTWTFASTAHVVEWVGAKPVLCDIEGSSLNIDVAQAEQLCTSRTKAIIPVHIAGYPCDMDAVAALAQKRKLAVIEDAAHALGTEYKGQKIGSISDVTCFSFYATKNLAMGEGGAASGKDSALIEKIRQLGYLGINKSAYKRYEKSGTWRYDVECLGYKYNLDNLHAAIGVEQLKQLQDNNEYRRALAEQYRKHLPNGISHSTFDDTSYHTYHIFPVFLPHGVDRDSFMEKLKDYNIGTSVHFIPLHLHTYYANRNHVSDFNKANSYFNRVLSLPMHCAMSMDDVDYVCEACELALNS